MERRLFSHTNRALLELGKELGRGGEGIVYQLKNDPGHVAKIYHAGKLPPIEKLRLMLQAPPDDPTNAMQHVSIVWLSDLVQNHKGQIFGIVMPKIPWGIPIHQLYHPRSRREKFVGFDWRYLHRSAANLAAAVAAIHAKGYVIGDLNESNVLVQPTALVSMIDTDSFQVPNPNGETFRCRVGKPEFTAPELQSVRLSTVDRSEEHDRFALAVMIFLLLMEGSHPFRGIGGPPELGERIQQGLYPYSLTGSSSVKAPPLNPPFRNLHPEIQQLLQTCFVDGFSHPYRRPRAAVWADALSYIESDFQQCSRNRHHVYLQTIPRCPWCERKQLLRGRDPFPEKPQKAQKTTSKSASSPNTGKSSPQKPKRTTQKPKTKKNRPGFFTVANILALLVVIGIASSLLVPSILTAFHRSKFNRTTVDMREIVLALGSYMVDTDQFPKAEEETEFHVGLLPKEYYEGSVTDAWGTPLRYQSNGWSYRLVSYGKDKAPGRRSDADFDADIIFENGEHLEQAADVTQLPPLETPARLAPAPTPEPSPPPASSDDYMAFWQQRVQEHPEDSAARLKLAYAYENARQLDDVIRECLELLKYDADSVEGKMLLAWTYARQNEELDRALELAQEVKEARASSWAFYTLGGVHYAREEYESALQALARSLDKADEDFDQQAEAHRLSGLCYESLEQFELALEAVDKALALAPNSENAKEDRERIMTKAGPELHSTPEAAPASQDGEGWEYTYTSDKATEALVIRATNDGAYLVAGQIGESGLLLKLDAQGKVIWQKTLVLIDEAYSQIRALDITETGEIVVAGHTQRATEDRRDRLFCSFSEEKLDWDCTSYQSTNYNIHELHAMRLTPDGGFTIAGCVKSPDSDVWKIMAQQFDAEQSFVWGKYYFPKEGGYSCGFDLEAYDDNSGNSERIVGGTWNGQGIVYKLDSQQEVVWDERFKGEIVNTLQLLPDGGVLLAGTGEKNWFTRLDTNGEELWGKVFNHPGRVPARLYHAENGDYVLAGFARASGDQKAEVWVMRIDLDGGEPEYLYETSVNNPTEIASIAQASDGSYLLAGHYLKDGLKKLWVIKSGK